MIKGKAVYWKNGVVHYLTDTTIQQDSYAKQITFSGSDMYIVGDEMLSPSNNWSGVYWKNGFINKLPASLQSNAGSLAVSGSDVYVTGLQFPYFNFNGNAVY